MIVSFANSDSERVWRREMVKSMSSDLQRSAHRKMLILDAADYISDLRRPPGNKLEALSGNRKGQHSIRINEQWRICFRWTKAGPADIEIVDYH